MTNQAERTIRDFENFKVSDDFTATVNTRAGEKTINLQEVMAARLAFSTDSKVFGWHVTDKQIADAAANGETLSSVRHYFDLPYGKIEDMYASEQWNTAKVDFVNLNSLSVEDAKKLTGGGRAKSTSANGVKFTGTHAGNLGKAIFAACEVYQFSNSDIPVGCYGDDAVLFKQASTLSDFVNNLISGKSTGSEFTGEKLASRLSGFDVNNAGDAKRQEVIHVAIDAFVAKLASELLGDAIAKERQRLELEKQAQEELRQEIRQDALDLLSLAGNTEPTDAQVDKAVDILMRRAAK